MNDIDDLINLDIEALECLYNSPIQSPSPTGRYEGVFLCRLDEPGNRRPLYWGSKAFEFVPFGIDFDTCCWYFFHQKLQSGKFRTETAPSRWRDSRVIKLHYDVSHLPVFVKNVLYDEVKPLSKDLCLALGGFNQATGNGDQFFFALKRIK